MKRILTIFTGFIILYSCHNSTSSEEPADKGKDIAAAGSDRDAHGCIGSAGYSWSELLQECIRPFERGVKLDPVVSEGTAQFNAFVIISAEKRTVELFLPEDIKPVLIRETERGIYASDPYIFRLKDSSLQIGGTLKYKAVYSGPK